MLRCFEVLRLHSYFVPCQQICWRTNTNGGQRSDPISSLFTFSFNDVRSSNWRHTTLVDEGRENPKESVRISEHGSVRDDATS